MVGVVCLSSKGKQRERLPYIYMVGKQEPIPYISYARKDFEGPPPLKKKPCSIDVAIAEMEMEP